MKHLLKTIFATSALVAIAGNASAQDSFEDTFDVKFTFDRTAPAEVTYERLVETAKKPCQIQYPLSTTGYSRDAMKRFRRKCEGMLIDQAINSIDKPSLTALHKVHTGKSPSRILLTNAKPATKPHS